MFRHVRYRGELYCLNRGNYPCNIATKSNKLQTAILSTVYKLYSIAGNEDRNAPAAQ